MFEFDNSYHRLPDRMYTSMAATTVSDPDIFALNRALLSELGATPSDADWAAVFSGNLTPEGAAPLAQAYGGHQFGHWNPGLGDGRALLLGEVVTPRGRFDIQLKGSGRTPYSRSGDGRAWLGPVIREYLMSEAMHALGVPTTRALAAVTTGDTVYRETALPGAVLTRVASSHIRVGTFQLFSFLQDPDALQALFDHTQARHFPNANGPTEVLQDMTNRQADLIAQWISLGFIHGVMNTDNMLICGETIDYGPCAFMDGYHPMRVFSSIDRQGRYAYGNQPKIAVWNIAQFASALVTLMPDQDAAIDEFTKIVNSFADRYAATSARLMAAKIGLPPTETSADLVNRLLQMMSEVETDFTLTFANLPAQMPDHPDAETWGRDWRAQSPDLDKMQAANPWVIPRTHQIEAAITAAVTGDFGRFNDMLGAVTQPFTRNDMFEKPPLPDEVVPQTFCGT
jgi:uncharacterized protein YdiU (UPF0061 family)